MLREGSVWLNESVDIHYTTILKYNSLSLSSYIELPDEFDHPKKGLINIQNQNVDDECFRWCLIRYLNPVDRNPARIERVNKKSDKQLDLKEIEFPLIINYY